MVSSKFKSDPETLVGGHKPIIFFFINLVFTGALGHERFRSTRAFSFD